MFFIFLIFSYSKLIITEVMANPKGKTGRYYPEDRNEFIEVYNLSSDTVDISAYKITDLDAIDSIVPWKDSSILIKYPTLKINTTKISPNSYCLILDPEYTFSEPQGDEIQPYNFPESLIVVSVENTTIGNELQQKDPLILFSLNDTSTFGTPFEEDSFPIDIKDGYSYERISFHIEDKKENWSPSLFEHGTPGRDNSVFFFSDPALLNFICEDFNRDKNFGIFKIQIVNNGFFKSESVLIKIFNNTKYKKEILLVNLEPKKDSFISFILDSLDFGYNKLEVKLLAKKDFDTTNNYYCLELPLFKKNEYLIIKPQIFYKNLDKIIKFEFFLPDKGDLNLEIFDLKGKLIKRFNKKIDNKEYFFVWNLSENLKNGIYLAILRYKNNNQTIEDRKSFIISNGGD
ncbi:MAG: T9SS type A sorting domain-containing protein [candidate division WOR-3 bacterium]|nr:T9SS type A sorting domain-containing protein [candidate division WOR-3 bacterium]MCX7836360.1 T9SS type A sorting domain-containing protein [candidate division WOR-3 bacterium]MDW8113535.1 T9SS type A sorting domain-containing protein [candidate division WOR-3 bacterium]